MPDIPCYLASDREVRHPKLPGSVHNSELCAIDDSGFMGIK